MNAKSVLIVALGAGLLVLTAPTSAQQAAGDEAPAEMSDVGVIAPAPYDIEPRITLSKGNREQLRKLEDKQLGELRELEDRYAKELRALRARQYAEREALLKGFGGK